MKHYLFSSAALFLGLSFSSISQAEVITFDATIKSVDTTTRTLTVERKGKTRNLDVSRKAKITINGEKSDFDSLKSGQTAELSYHDDLEIVLKIDVSGEAASETIQLFNKKSLEGWKGKKSAWTVSKGELVNRSGNNVTLLSTEQEFEDFELQCEFKLKKKGQGGIFLRGRYEVQLLDDPSYPDVNPNQLCGSIWRKHAPSEDAYAGTNQWNSLTVRLEGEKVSVTLNDVLIIREKPILGRETSGVRVEEPGPITLQTADGKVRFRSITIQELPQE